MLLNYYQNNKLIDEVLDYTLIFSSLDELERIFNDVRETYCLLLVQNTPDITWSISDDGTVHVKLKEEVNL